MNKNGLVVRLAIIVILAASAVGLVATQIFYQITYNNEYGYSIEKIEQLHQTVSSTASIATYLEDEELVREVVKGLVSNDIIDGVAVTTPALKVTSQKFINNENTKRFILFSPFEESRVVGTLSITPNIEYIKFRAREIGVDNSVTTIAQIAIVALVIILVTYFIITKPIIHIANVLHNIRPGTNERVPVAKSHEKSELGSLVHDVNLLLEKAEFQISEERNLRNEVLRLSKHFQMLFEHSSSPIVLSEPGGDILLYNRAFMNILQQLDMPIKRNFGSYLIELFSVPDGFEESVTQALENEGSFSGEFKLASAVKDQALWVQTIITATVDDNYNKRYQITLHDISQRKKQLESLNRTANTDALTKLLNRRGAEKSIRSLIQSRTPFTLFLLDLNKFKPINDIYGHDAGDEILKHIANKLMDELRRRDLICRWGGDEFLVVVPNLNKIEAFEVATKAYYAIATPYFVEKYQVELSVGASIGGVAYPEDDMMFEGLIDKADAAMYHTKALQKQGVQRTITFFKELSSSENE